MKITVQQKNRISNSNMSLGHLFPVLTYVLYLLSFLESTLPINSTFPSMQAFIHFTFDLLYPIHTLGFQTSYNLHI